MMKDSIIFGLSNNHQMAHNIAKQAHISLGQVERLEFFDGELLVRAVDSVRGKNVFVVQSTCPPVNSSLMELLIFIDALRRGSAKTINLIIPYYGYARQDRKNKSHEPITAKLVAKLLETAGMERCITFDLHSPQIEGFFEVPVDNLSALSILANYICKHVCADYVIVAPDKGGVVRARLLANLLKLPLAIIDKRRIKNNAAEVMNVLGDVQNKKCLIIDDMIDTAGTIIEGANALKASGASSIIIAATHPVFSGPAVERLKNCSAIEKIIVTDTIPLPESKLFAKLEFVSVEKFLGEVVRAIHSGSSIGTIYQKYTNTVKPWKK